MNLKYDDAMEYLENKVNPLGSVLGLDTMRELLKRIGNPERELRMIHVAGTNGKGSVSSFLAAALKENGYRIGRYISPSVVDYREKIQVNGNYIPKTKVVEYLGMLFDIALQMQEEGFSHPTAFELETAMAFLYLRDKGCDFSVIEVGMGGRDDATNVIPSPLLCLITSISEDHLGMIGNTLEEIAETKAGIIKDCTTVVVAPQKETVKEVIRRECAGHRDVTLRFVEEDCILTKSNSGSRSKEVSTKSHPLKSIQKFSYKQYKNVELSMLGDFQPENAALALEALDALKKKEIRLKDEKSLKGMKECNWPARFEILGKKPLVIADGAHNPDAVKRLMKTMDNYFTNCPKIYIMGILKDKAVPEIIALSAPGAACIITVTPPNNKRAMPAFELAGLIREINPNVTAADSVEEALEEATLMAGPDGVVLAFGSLSYQGKLRTAYDAYIKNTSGKGKRNPKNGR